MKLNLLVIRSRDIVALKKQYELLGFEFEYHKHGHGPYHFAAEQDGFVFEIYPTSQTPEANIRLGFSVNNIHETLKDITDSSWLLVQELSQTEWGEMAVLQDLDGRKVEIKDGFLSN